MSSTHGASASNLTPVPVPFPVDGDVDETELAQLKRLVEQRWFPSIIAPQLFEFILAEGRVPRLGDARAPWTYKGWLLLQLIFAAGAKLPVTERWVYYFEMLAGNRLPDRPIPQIAFVEPPQEKNNPLALMRKLVEKLGRDHGYGERALNIFLEWLAFALAADDDPAPDISEKTGAWLYREFDLGPLLRFPRDYAGDLLEEMRGASKRFQGFFLTHAHVCEFMSEMITGDLNAGELLRARALEPAVGSGRQLLHLSNRVLRLDGVDVDPVCTKLSRINGCLTTPWLTFPLPASVFKAGGTPGLNTPVVAPAQPVSAETAEVSPVSPDAPGPERKSRRGARRDDGIQSSLFDM